MARTWRRRPHGRAPELPRLSAAQVAGRRLVRLRRVHLGIAMHMLANSFGIVLSLLDLDPV